MARVAHVLLTFHPDHPSTGVSPWPLGQAAQAADSTEKQIFFSVSTKIRG
jgi:hypothetical protein